MSSNARSADRAANGGSDDPLQMLRALGARAHQLRAATRAADHFNACDGADDRDTGSWLISGALGVATELAADIDSLARTLKDRPSDAALQSTVAALRVRVHQLQAAVRAADHFLEQDSSDGRDTGGWLIATAVNLAHKLAGEMDDGTVPTRRPVLDKAQIEPHDAGLQRRISSATAPLRGAA